MTEVVFIISFLANTHLIIVYGSYRSQVKAGSTAEMSRAEDGDSVCDGDWGSGLL